MKYTPPSGYHQKFASFIQLCEDAKKNGNQLVIVAQPWVIGDTYDEVIESLSRLSEAGLALQIAGPIDRAQ